jgi:hypothetical protein
VHPKSAVSHLHKKESWSQDAYVSQNRRSFESASEVRPKKICFGHRKNRALLRLVSLVVTRGSACLSMECLGLNMGPISANKQTDGRLYEQTSQGH